MDQFLGAQYANTERGATVSTLKFNIFIQESVPSCGSLSAGRRSGGGAPAV